VDQPTFVVHGHFYQPPRENPWTETVTAEPSAAPFHDWNERITAEAYRPNGWARIVDDRDRVVAIVDNYAHLSFNVGPTLATWLADHEPDVLARMVEGDRQGGGAIAQAYNHLILPLATERDVRTQVRWGLADFAHRFGRPAEGMWLPETAVNDDVLRVLAEEGVRFTILAPDQAVAVRPLDQGEGEWTDVSGGAIDTTRTYRWVDPTDPRRTVDLVFYDGGLSHDLAFGLGSVTAESLIARIAQRGGLTCVATDGETFGHHHHFAERTLAYALPVAAPRAGVRTSGIGACLEESPPAWEARITESSWSCGHGVERWRADCGCSTGGTPGADQAWREPLRRALDGLRDHGVEVFESRGAAVLRDPWSARDAYIGLLLGDRTLESFVDEHVTGNVVEALTLLEQQRHALLMYTSCAWFFWDLAGLETVQCLRYAARAMDLLAELGEDPAQGAFLDVLSEGRSNQSGEGDGGEVWRRHVEPARVDADRAVAHLALADLLRDTPPAGRLACWEVRGVAHRHTRRGSLALCAGTLELVHTRTRRRSRHAYAAAQLGSLEVLGAVRAAEQGDRDARDVDELVDAVERGTPLTTVLALLAERFGPAEFGLEQALPDAADQIVADAAAALEARFEAAFEQLYEAAEPDLAALTTAGYRLSPSLRLPAERALGRRLEAEILAQGGSWDRASYEAALGLVEEAYRHGLRIDVPRARRALEQSFMAAVGRATGDDANAVDAALALLGLADALGVRLALDRAQELLYDALTRRVHGPEGPLRRIGLAVGLTPGRLGIPPS
jgi:alpha-amylase/alpha-mannosidase (GH57 family)